MLASVRRARGGTRGLALGPDCDERAAVPNEARVIRGSVRADRRLVLVYRGAFGRCAHAETGPRAQATVQPFARAQLPPRLGLGDEERARGGGVAAQVRRALDQDRTHPPRPDQGDRDAARRLVGLTPALAGRSPRRAPRRDGTAGSDRLRTRAGD